MTAGTQYNSNLFRQARNEVDDFSFNVSPSIGLGEEEGGRLEWDLSYQPRYSDFIEFDERDRWNHVGNARGTYQLSGRTRLSFFDQLTYTENTPNQQVSPNAPDPADVNTSTRTTLRNTLGLSLTHAISSRLTWGLNGSYLMTDISGGNRANFTQLGATSQLTYAFSRRNTWGIGAGYSWVGFSDSNEDDLMVNAGASQTFRLFASWSYSFSRTLSFRISGGPARVIQDRREQENRRYPGPGFRIAGIDRPLFLDLGSCATNNNDGTFQDCGARSTNDALVVDDSEVAANTRFADAGELAAIMDERPSSASQQDSTDTFFAEAQIVKRWDRVSLTGSYRRTQNPESSAGTTSIVDTVRVSLSYRPDRKWSIGLSGGFNQRETTNEQVVRSTAIVRDSGLLGRVAGTPDFIPATRPVAEVIGEEFELSNQGLDVTQYNASLTVNRRLTERLRANFRFGGVIQESQSQRQGTANDFEEFRVTLGFTYDFEPVRLF